MLVQPRTGRNYHLSLSHSLCLFLCVYLLLLSEEERVHTEHIGGLVCLLYPSLPVINLISRIKRRREECKVVESEEKKYSSINRRTERKKSPLKPIFFLLTYTHS